MFQVKSAIVSSPIAIVPQERIHSPVAHQPPKDDSNVAGPSVNPSTSHNDDNHPIVWHHSPPNIFTPLSVSFNVYQQFQWKKENWDLERKQFLKTIK